MRTPFCTLFYRLFSRLVTMHKLSSNILDLVLFGYLKGEYHGNNPEMSKLLHKAVREKSETAYAVYQQHLANRPITVSHNTVTFKLDPVFWNK